MSTARAASLRLRSATFGGVAAAVTVAAMVIVRTAAFARRPDLLSTALAIDLCVTVPLAWMWLLVRPGLVRPRTILLVVGLGALTARLVLPASERSLALGARLLTAPAELALLGYAVTRFRRQRREQRSEHAIGLPAADLLEELERALGSLGLAGRLAAYEMATLGYAVGRGRTAEPPTGGRHAMDARGWGAIVGALCMAVVVETVPVHLLLSQWNTGVAWGLTALSAYSLIWLIGDWRAMGARTTELSGDTLRLRVGMRWSADIALADIANVERATWRTVAEHGVLNTLKPLQPNVLIRLRRPTRVRGPFGVPRTAAALGIRLAVPDRFLEALPPAGPARQE